MVLNKPQIELQNSSENFIYKNFKKKEYYCLDGFPKENNPCIIVMQPPKRDNYVFMGIKPSVLVLAKEDVNPEVL